MTQDEIDRQFNERVANQAHTANLKAAEGLQKTAAGQGVYISRREATRELKERDQAQYDEKARVERAVEKGKPPGIDNLLNAPSGVRAQPSAKPGFTNLPEGVERSASTPVVFSRRAVDGGTGETPTTVIVWVMGNPFKGDFMLSGSLSAYP